MKYGLGILLMCLVPSLSIAIFGIGDIVLDPTNLVQTTLTAGRTLQSNINEAQIMANQISSFLQQAKNFVTIPDSLLNDIKSTIQQYYDILQEGQDLSYNVQSVVGQFNDLYSTGWNGNGSMMAKAKRVLGVMRDVGRTATKAQAVYDRLSKSKATTERLLAVSQAAPGSLAAIQANTALMAVAIEQQGQLVQLQATAGRMETAWLMREMLAEERAQQNAERFMQGYGEGTFRGPGEGRGVVLPR